MRPFSSATCRWTVCRPQMVIPAGTTAARKSRSDWRRRLSRGWLNAVLKRQVCHPLTHPPGLRAAATELTNTIRIIPPICHIFSNSLPSLKSFFPPNPSPSKRLCGMRITLFGFHNFHTHICTYVIMYMFILSEEKEWKSNESPPKISFL